MSRALTKRAYDLRLSRVAPECDMWLDDFVRPGRTDRIIMIGQQDQDAALNRTAEQYRAMVVWGASDPATAYTRA